MADGYATIVTGQEEVINKILTLKMSFMSLDFTNFLSIQKLTKDSNCNVVFDCSNCIFQEHGTRRMIGHAREKNSLYYLEESSGQDKVMNPSPFSLLSESSKFNKDHIWLQHLRLGHPSFRVLKIMFSLFFKDLDIDNYKCDVCEFAKYKHASFPINNKRTTIPFNLVHSDVWGSMI